MTRSAHIQVCGRMSISGPLGVIDQRGLSGAIGRQMLAFLVVTHGPVGRYELIDVIWGGQPTSAVDSTVNATVSRLRSTIIHVGGTADALLSEQGLIQLDGRYITSDFHTALRSIDRCVPNLTRGDYPQAWAHAATAYSIASRRFLPGIENEWADARRDHLHHIICRSLAVVALTAIARARPQDAIFAARELVRKEPHSDRAVQILVSALLSAGDRGASRVAVHDWASRLQSELGMLPDDHTLDALDQVINRRSQNVIDVTELIPLAL